MKSKTIIFPEAQKVEVVEKEIPSVRENGVLVKNIISLVSIGTETTCYKGIFDPDTNWFEWVKYPFKPGYSTAGFVVEVGKGVKNFRVGDKVVTVGSHEQYTYIEVDPSNTAYNKMIEKIPEGITPEQAVWHALAAVGTAGVRRAHIEFGENVVVIGAGPVGQMIISFARIAGAVNVIVIDKIGKRLEYAITSGATHILQMDVESAIPEVKKILEGEEPEVVFDTTGHYSVLPIACHMARKYGRVILVGDCPQPSKQVLGPVVFKSLDVLGVHGNKYNDIEALPWSGVKHRKIFFSYLQQGRMDTKHLISHRYKPEQAPELYHRLLADRSFCMGVVFDWK